MAQILLIDDDEGIRTTIEQRLSAAGYELDLAENGVEGLQAVKANTPDLVICDILMPEKEGIETIMDIRNMHPALPIVAISGGGKYIPAGSAFLDEVLESAKILGADYILRKPFRLRELQELVEKTLSAAKRRH